MPYTASLQLPLSASPPTLPTSSRNINTSRLLEPTLDWNSSSLYPTRTIGGRASFEKEKQQSQTPLISQTQANLSISTHSSLPTFSPRGVVIDAALGGLSPLSARILGRLDHRPIETRVPIETPIETHKMKNSVVTLSTNDEKSTHTVPVNLPDAHRLKIEDTVDVKKAVENAVEGFSNIPFENTLKAAVGQSVTSTNTLVLDTNSSTNSTLLSTPATLTASALVLKVLMSPAFRGVGVDEGTLDELSSVLAPEEIGTVRHHMAFRPTPSVGLGSSAGSSNYVIGSRWSDRGSMSGGEGDSDGGGSRTRTPGSTHSRTHTPPPPSWHMPGAGPGHFPHEPHRPNSENRRGRTPESDSKSTKTKSTINSNSDTQIGDGDGGGVSRGRITPVSESPQHLTQQQQQQQNNPVGRDQLFDGDLHTSIHDRDEDDEEKEEEERFDDDENDNEEVEEEEIGADGDGSVGGSHGGSYSSHQRQSSAKSISSVRFGGAEEIPQLEGEGEDGASFIFASGSARPSSLRSQLSSPRFAGDGFGGTTDDDFIATSTSSEDTGLVISDMGRSVQETIPDTGSGASDISETYSTTSSLRNVTGTSLVRRVGFNDDHENEEIEATETEKEKEVEVENIESGEMMEQLRQRGIEQQALRDGYIQSEQVSSNLSQHVLPISMNLTTASSTPLINTSSSLTNTSVDSLNTRIFTFVQYNDRIDEIEVAIGEDDVPYRVHEMAESDFYEAEASVGLLPYFQSVSSSSSSSSSLSISASLYGIESVSSSSLPVIVPGQVPKPGLALLPKGMSLPSPFSIIDTSTPPKVFDWNGGDVKWDVAPSSPTTSSSIVAHVDGNLVSQTPRFEAFSLRVVYEAGKTGFEEEKEFSAVVGSTIAGRYKVIDYIGSAAFSSALSCTDLVTGDDVCLKVIKNSKDFLDQSLDEIKLLRYINAQGDADANHILRIRDYFYHKEHLFIVTELLKDNLYEFGKYLSDHGHEPFFTLPRVQRIAIQTLKALAFIHTRGLIHCDLKPENILIKSYSRCEVKVIDFGSSCYFTDRLSVYIQSRSYRAPEVVLGLPYSPKIDIWSLGCILAELLTGRVLFANDSVQTMLARVQSLFGPFPSQMLEKGRDVHKFFRANRDGSLFERDQDTETEGGDGVVSILSKHTTNLRIHLRCEDEGFLGFVAALLAVDPEQRPTAEQALQHPWLQTLLPSMQYQLPS